MASAPRPVAAAAMVPESTASSPAPDLVPVTHVSMCRCEGDGLANAIVRQSNTFAIISCNETGQRKTEGGDEFVVKVHGAGTHLRGRERARPS